MIRMEAHADPLSAGTPAAAARVASKKPLYVAYYVVMVEDCVASPKKELHPASLENVRLYWGEVVPARDVTAAWTVAGRGR